MKDEKETKEKLILSAKKEFLEKGYMKSSLRNICKDAGVTTGALYFFFTDKQDLFASIIDRPWNRLFEMLKNNYQKGVESKEAVKKAIEGNYEKDFIVSKEIISFLYQYYDEFILLTQKSQGSKYESCIDELITLTEMHYRRLADEFSYVKGQKRIEDSIIHWISHVQIESVMHLLVHDKSKEQAVKNFENMMRYLIAGWSSLFEENEKTNE